MKTVARNAFNRVDARPKRRSDANRGQQGTLAELLRNRLRRRVCLPLAATETTKIRMAEHRSFRLTTAPNDECTNQPGKVSGWRYSESIKVAVAQQAVVLIFASLILDGGQILRFCAIAAIASWICTLVIILRRPKQPTKLDLGIVKFGFWPAMPLVALIGFVVGLVR